MTIKKETTLLGVTFVAKESSGKHRKQNPTYFDARLYDVVKSLAIARDRKLCEQYEDIIKYYLEHIYLKDGEVHLK